MSSNFVKLGQVATFINGKAFKPNEWTQSGIPIIRIQNLTNNAKEFNYYQGNLEPRYIVKKGDILISWSASLGVFEWDGPEAALNQHIFKVQFNKLDVDKTYFKFIVSQVIHEMLRFVHGSTMKHIVKNDFDNTKIPLPKFSDQQRIATILDHADSIRRKNKQILEKYNELAQSVFYEMFGDPYTNSKHWEIFKIKDIASTEKNAIKAGPFGSSLKKEFYVSKGYKIYGQEQVIKDDFNFGNYYINDELYNKLKSCRIKEGDILISLVGSYGLISIVPKSFEPGIINPRLMKISLNHKVANPIYFKFLLQSKGIRTKIENSTHGGTMEIVNVGIMKNIDVPIPPLELQIKFIEILNGITSQKSLTQLSLQKSEELFQSLLQRAFKGEL